MALYVKFAQEKRPRTVREFLKKYYSYSIDAYHARGHDTWFDPECRRLHCRRTYRSFDDLYDLVTTYYPSITTKKMMHYLLTTKIPLQGKDRFALPHLAVCGGMRRIRFIPYHTSAYEYIDRVMADSKYTWRQLLTPLGINNIQEFNEYIKNSK